MNIDENIMINFSNHPYKKWSVKQKNEAGKYGKVIDIQFPDVDPSANDDEVKELARKYYEKIIYYHPIAVMCQGEFTLCFNVVKLLKEKNIVVVAACSRRIVEEMEDTKIVKFVFEGFREY